MAPQWLWNKTIAVFDLETDYIPTTTIFCNSIVIVTIDHKGNVTKSSPKAFTCKWVNYTNGPLLESVTIINSCDYCVAHNLIGFDINEIPKHLGVTITAKPLDTLILAKIIYSKDELFAIDASLKIDKHLHGRYSLEAFAQRLGQGNKIEYNDFSHLNKEMVTYCDKDTDLAADLLILLLSRDNFPLEAVVEIEHQAAQIIYEQTVFGFYIDIEKTRALNTKLLTEKLELATKLSAIFSPKFLRDGQIKSYKKLSKVKKYLPNTKYIPLIGTK